LDWLEAFPPAIRHGGLVRAFDAWTAAHPGTAPDTSSWSEERRLAWDDLQALKALGMHSAVTMQSALGSGGPPPG
jgi:hypothetical protein